VDIVPEGVDPLGRARLRGSLRVEDDEDESSRARRRRRGGGSSPSRSPTAAIDLAAGARYRATGKRKTAIARVTLKPGTGTYLVNGRTLEEHFPRVTLQRNIRQPLETVGYQERMDVVARLHGGGISAQAGALRHGVSRALLEADPNLRGELKRRGFLTRDSRVKERKKAGLKKARKRPQFSKR
jgi:small subunit ribosomal protein S9